MDIEKIISVSLLTPMGDPKETDCIWGMPLLLWGSPGIGKSDRVYASSKAVGLPCEPVFPATRQPEDFSGVPVPVGTEGDVVIACILGAVNKLQKAGRGVLFLDEISCARPAVQSSLLSVARDRRVGDTMLNPKIRILAAANPPEEVAA